MKKGNESSPSYSKEDFLSILSNMTPIEMNRIIEERGKEVKPIPLVIELGINK